ncbi:transmembrane protein DUF3566 [Isoptericola sp. CG 20/1183]|uniref:Transmembrane protein DUF3566 n=1 Tax=Isoptericola halotolerans TaxID=300560 RepID=A0ABX5EH14_9MICO|nr:MULTISPECIES: DUF3566 domain-containing protein [Isoptericola]PRZ08788.1 transmembrane protein DUF3566 [Isoptericola halotolerans]PRZ10765.1 transmembrane protein DUF3566 [Isoptericola sp. CG 20/1183]
MASDKNAGQAGTKTAEAVDSTQQMSPVPAAPTTSGEDRVPAPSNGSTSAAAKADAKPTGEPVGEVSVAEPASSTEGTMSGTTTGTTSKPAPADTTPAEAASAEQAPTNGSAVKDGAVKAAAAALAAARNAAKKVQSAASSSTGAEPPDAASSGSQSAPPPPPSTGTTQSASRPEMHYSAGGVHGAAQPEASPAGAQYGGAQYGAATGAQPTLQSAASPSEGLGSPRRVRLSVSRIDPWSIMKLAFLLSVAIGIMIVVATAVVWYSLNSLGTFATIQEFLIETMGPQTINITQFVEFERMISLSTLIALVNMVLFTAIATIMAILYNITAALVGGVHLTLTDD